MLRGARFTDNIYVNVFCGLRCARRIFGVGAFAVLACVFPGVLCARAVGLSALADDSALRRKIAAGWLTETPAAVLANKSFIATLESGERVEVKARRGESGVTVMLAREENGAFPGWAAGSWAYTRSNDGEPVRLRFFPRSDPYTFIQLRPFNHNKCQADIVVYDAYITRAWPLAGSLESVLTKPLPEILAGLAGAPLRYFEPKPDDYRDVRSLFRALRQNVGALSYEDDGAISAGGDYVFIKNGDAMPRPGLNCSGFAKWVIDGMMRPLTGKRLDIEVLKQPAGERGTSYTAAYERIRDPFFGLDWIRNLAAAAGRTFKGEVFARPLEYEVREAPFSTVITRAGGRSAPVDRSYPGFLEEAGFGIEGLGALLYTLAIDEPGYIYLGAVNNDQGPRPRMRQYFHIAVFIPYFDDDGTFRVALFESASENSFNKFRIRYPAHYINLVRIPVEGTFEP